jgi:hypothetical protein
MLEKTNKTLKISDEMTLKEKANLLLSCDGIENVDLVNKTIDLDAEFQLSHTDTLQLLMNDCDNFEELIDKLIDFLNE